MPGPSPVPSPQFYTVDDVAAVLAADFAARGVSAVVQVGEWDPEIGRGEGVVFVGLGAGKVGEPAGHYQPGSIWAPPGTTGEVARAMLDDAQRFSFLVHAPSANSAEGAALAARRATDALKRATLAALRRALSAPFREPAEVAWPKKNDPPFADYAAFVYGSVCTFELTLASPILDDPHGVIPVTQVSTDSEFLFPDGTTTQPETN